jgi:hypothetical protein
MVNSAGNYPTRNESNQRWLYFAFLFPQSGIFHQIILKFLCNFFTQKLKLEKSKYIFWKKNTTQSINGL